MTAHIVAPAPERPAARRHLGTRVVRFPVVAHPPIGGRSRARRRRRVRRDRLRDAVRQHRQLRQSGRRLVVPGDHLDRDDVRHPQRRHRPLGRLDVRPRRRARRLQLAVGLAGRHRRADRDVWRHRAGAGNADRQVADAGVHRHAGRSVVRSRVGVQGLRQRQHDAPHRPGAVDDEPRSRAGAGGRRSGVDRLGPVRGRSRAAQSDTARPGRLRHRRIGGRRAVDGTARGASQDRSCTR